MHDIVVNIQSRKMTVRDCNLELEKSRYVIKKSVLAMEIKTEKENSVK